MKKYIITESDLHGIIKESVRKILSELDWRTYATALEKAGKMADDPNIGNYEKRRRENQKNNFHKQMVSTYDKQYGLDKIKQREMDYCNTPEYISGKKGKFEYTQGELRRLQRAQDDEYDFYQGKHEFKDGKWGLK